MKNEQNAPKIRFKGFTDAWELRKLSLSFDILQNNTLSRSELSIENGAARNVHYGDILVKYGEVLDLKTEELPFIQSSQTVDKLKGSFLQNGDIIMADTAEDETAGKCTEIANLDNMNVLAGLHTIPLRPKQKYAVGYLGYYMNSGSFHDKLLPLMQGTKVTSISKSALQGMSILRPADLEEQRQIGTYFRTLDHLITLHQRKCETLQKLKKSMLQKMFPKNGSCFPEIRFAGFTDAWEQRELGEISDIVGGGTPSTSNPDYWDGDIDWYAPAEISEQIFINSSSRKITKSGFENSSAKMLPVGTVLFTSRAGIGKTAILCKEGCTNQGFQSIVPHENELDSYFIFSRTEELKRYGETKGAGSTFVEVSGKQMTNMTLMMPTSFEEQRQIGTYFRTLDHLITLHQRKLETLKKLKKAMLQKMFI